MRSQSEALPGERQLAFAPDAGWGCGLMPPTAGLAGHTKMPVRFHRGLALLSGPVFRSAQSAAKRSRLPGPVRATHVAPDSKPVVTVTLDDWPCRSTCWIVDHDSTVFEAARLVLAFTGGPVWSVLPQTTDRIGSVIRATQEKYLWNRMAGLAADGGFRVECCLPDEHAADCRVDRWVWNRMSGQVQVLVPV